MSDVSYNPPAGGGAGATNLDGLTDVAINTPLEYQTLEYNGASWTNAHASVATYVRNADNVTLNVGTVVYLFGATGDHATVKRADNDSDTTSAKTVGLVAGSSIAQNAHGVVVTRGYVDGINLSTGYTAGDLLYLGEDGGFTKTKPTAPEHLVFVGVVVRATNNGIIYVATQNGYELDELHNVAIASQKDRHVLRYHAASGLWRNEDPALQKPVNLKWFYPVDPGILQSPSTNATFGGACRIVFDTACSITDIGISLFLTYTGATTRTYRLGIYRDNGSNYPGTLAADAGTVSIAQNAAAGQKSVTLGTAVSVAANELMWLVVAVDASNSGPNLFTMTGHAEWYRANGAVNDYFPLGVAYNYTAGGSSTSFPATYASSMGITASGVPTPFVKVSV